MSARNRLFSADASRRRAGVLIAAWVMMQGLCGWQTGVRTVGDAFRYLEGAGALLRGEMLSPLTSEYSLTAALYALGLALGPGSLGIVALQLAVSLAAVLCFSAAAQRAYGARAGFLAGLALAWWWEIQRRNFFLLSTSFFVSFSVLSVSGAVLARTRRQKAVTLVLAGATALLRPEGALVGVAIGAFWALHWARPQAWSRRLGLAAAGGVAALVAVWPVLLIVARHEVIERLLGGVVIGGHEPSSLGAMARATATLPVSGAPPVGLAWLAGEGPQHLLGVAAARITAWLVHLKPYYSAGHNMVLAATYYPAYVLAIVGLRVAPRVEGLRLLLLSWVGLEAVFVAFSWEDWSGRWLLHVMPAVLMLGAAAADHLTRGPSAEAT